MLLDLNDAETNLSPWRSASGGIDFNEAAHQHSFDMDELWARIKADPIRWVRHLYPHGRLSADRREYRLANPQGGAPRKMGSFCIYLTGDMAGTGHEWADGRTYTAMDMVEAMHGLRGAEAINYLSSLVGMEDGSAPVATGGWKPLAKVDRSPDVRLIRGKCQPAMDTLVETYLRRRGLMLPASGDLLFCPDATDLAEKRGYPAMVGVIRLGTGEESGGLHITYLNDDGSKSHKKMLGTAQGGAVRLAPMAADGTLGVSEGIENGIAAMMMFPNVPVWASLSTSGMRGFQIPPGCKRLVIYSDAGSAGQAAAEELRAAALLAGVTADIVRPAGDDDLCADLAAGAQPQEPEIGKPPSYESIMEEIRGLNKETAPEVLNALARKVNAAGLGAVHYSNVANSVKRVVGISVSVWKELLAEVTRDVKSGAGNMPVAAQNMLRRYIYVRDINQFFDRRNRKFYPRDVVVQTHWYEMPPGMDGMPMNPEWFIKAHEGQLETVDGVTFMPGINKEIVNEQGERKLNNWVPSDVEPIAGDVTVFLDHIKYVFDGNEEAAGVFVSYMASLVRQPLVKVLWAPLIVSPQQGIGKSTIADFLVALLGEKNCADVSNDDVADRFNDWLDGKQLVVVHELMSDGKMEMANKLKGLITDPRIRINRKNMRPYEYTNRANFLMFSNYTDAARIEKGDRRYFVWVSQAKPRDGNYYQELRKWFADGGKNALLHYFLNYDLSGFAASGPAPMTKSKEVMIEYSMSNVERYLRDAYEAGDHPFSGDLVVANDAFDALDKKVRGITTKRIEEFLRGAGAVELGARKVGERKPKVWAVRNVDKWRLAGDIEIERAFLYPASGGVDGGILA
jgi:hypothetical protein